SPVDDAPVNTVPGPQTTNEDTAKTIVGTSTSDVDAGTVQVTLSAANGTLTLTTLSGLSFSVGDGTSDATMTFSGLLANINAALASYSYLPNLNFNGVDTLTVTTNDLGNTGTGGP